MLLQKCEYAALRVLVAMACACPESLLSVRLLPLRRSVG